MWWPRPGCRDRCAANWWSSSNSSWVHQVTSTPSGPRSQPIGRSPVARQRCEGFTTCTSGVRRHQPRNSCGLQIGAERTGCLPPDGLDKRVNRVRLTRPPRRTTQLAPHSRKRCAGGGSAVTECRMVTWCQPLQQPTGSTRDQAHADGAGSGDHSSTPSLPWTAARLSTNT